MYRKLFASLTLAYLATEAAAVNIKEVDEDELFEEEKPC